MNLIQIIYVKFNFQKLGFCSIPNFIIIILIKKSYNNIIDTLISINK